MILPLSESILAGVKPFIQNLSDSLFFSPGQHIKMILINLSKLFIR